MKSNEMEFLIEEAIKGFNSRFEEETGKIISVGDGIVTASGLRAAFFDEVVTFKNGERAIVIGLEPDIVHLMVLGDCSKIKAGEEVSRTGSFFKIKVGDQLVGRVLNGYGEAIDDLGPVGGEEAFVESKAPKMLDRSSVKDQVVTGIHAIDWFTPIGHGQRQLILGDRQLGKTTIATSVFLSLKNERNVYFVYVSIGQKISNTIKLQHLLKTNGVERTVLVVANGSDPASMRYLAPLVGTTIAGYFRSKGKRVIIVYDDLNQHAIAYREISLLLRRPPGKEAFPGDVFFLHSSLLEIAAQLNEEKLGGSITALPIVETLLGDVSSYLSTNVISITDGQVILNESLFVSGQKPAMDTTVSVSRIGGAVQCKTMKKIAGSIKLELALANELEKMGQFSGESFSADAKKTVDKGRIVREAMRQQTNSISPLWKQCLLLMAIHGDVIKEVSQVWPFYDMFDPYEKHKERIVNGEEVFIKEILSEIARKLGI